MPHVARYFSQRAYDSVFEPCLKKSKPDHSVSWQNKYIDPQQSDAQTRVQSSAASSDGNRNVSTKSGPGPGTNDDFLSGANYVPLTGTCKNFSEGNKNKLYKRNDGKPEASDGFLRGVGSVVLSGPSKHLSDSKKNESHKSDHVRTEANSDFLSSVRNVPLSGLSKHFSDDHKNESHKSKLLRPGFKDDFQSGVDYLPISGTSEHFCDEHKNESNKGNPVRPGSKNDFRQSADYVPLPGASKYDSDDHKNKSYKSNYGPTASDAFQNGADFVPLSGTAKLFSEHKNELDKKNHERQSANDDFLSGADYLPLSLTSKHFSDHKNESNKSNHASPGAKGNFLSGADYMSLSGTSKHLFHHKSESYKSSHVTPGANDDFLSGADYVPLSGTSKHSSDLKNESNKSNYLRLGAKDDCLSAADYLPLLGTSKHFSDSKVETYKSNPVRPGANDHFLSGADYLSLSGTSKHLSDDRKNQSNKGIQGRQRTSDDFLSGATYVPLSRTSKHLFDHKNESSKSNYVKPRANDYFLSGADYVPLPGTSKPFSDHKSEFYKSCNVRPVDNDSLSGVDYMPLSKTSNNYSCQALVKKDDIGINQQNLTLPKTDKQRSDSDSEVAFCETSTVFIGPLYKPPCQVELVSRKSSNTTNKPSSYKITTVGNTARRSDGKVGMDYELRQFYKELCELEAASDDQNIGQTSAEHQQLPQCSNAPASHSNRYDIQTSDPQPCNFHPAIQQASIPLNSHLKEDPISAANCPALPPDNHDTCDSLAQFKETTSPFISHALPLPGFQGPPPPSFGLSYGPSPSRFDQPLNFLPVNNILSSPFPENDKYYMVNDDHRGPWTQPACPNTPVSPERKFSPQGPNYAKPFLEAPTISSQEDLGDWISRNFDEHSFPEADNGPHEEYSHRFRDNVPYTHSARKLVLLRGVPGSGKSTLARDLLSHSPNGIVFSTDDYFWQDNEYIYDVTLLGDAHTWNQKRAKKAMDDGRSSVIIDNTNSQAWEMKPYVQMAIDRDYDVEFLEPNTWWKLDPNELEKRNTHRVPREKIAQMLERYEHNMTVGVVMSSVEPRRVRSNRPPPEARPRWGASVDCSQHSMSFHSRSLKLLHSITNNK